MKSLLKNFLLAAAAALLLAGCSGLGTGDATVEAEGLTEGRTLLTINVADFMNQATSAKKAARTINPAAFEGDLQENEDTRGLIDSYVLTGKSVTTGEQLKNAAGEALVIAATGEITGGIQLGSTEAPKSTHVDNSSGTPTNVDDTDDDGNVQYKVSIPYGSWELTLYALDANNKPLLQGQTFAVLKTAQSAIQFTLTTDGLTTPGSVIVKGEFTDPQGVAAVYTAALYDLTTGEKVYPTTDPATTAVGTGKTFTFTHDDVTPGRYSLQVRFYNDNAKTKQVGFWEDVVVVAPGRATNRQDIKCGNIIMQRPAAPSNLRAFLKNGSDSANGYTVVLTWDDNSNNEENFVVTLKEYNTETVAANTNPIKTVVLGLEEKASENKEIFFGNKLNKGGSLIASSTTCSLLLSYGKIYEVEIQAQNYVGLSDGDSATDGIQTTTRNKNALASGATLPDGVTADDTLFTTAQINRLKIKYNLDGGSLAIPEGYYGTDSAAVTKEGGIYTEYKNIYSIASADRVLSKVLLDIKEADATKPTLTNGTYKFLKWAKNDGSVFAADAVITYKGLDVKAIYDKTTKVSYKISNKYGNVIESEVSAVYDSQDLVPEVVVDATAGTKVPGHKAYKAGENIVFTVTPTTGTVDWMSVNIGNNPYDEIYSGEVLASTYTFTKVNELEVGPHTANVKIHLAGEDADVVYAFTFTFEIDR